MASLSDDHLEDIEDAPKSRRERGRRLRTSLQGKRLFQSTQATPSALQQTPQQSERLPNWTDAELSGLTEFMMLHTDGKTWVAHKDDRFWNWAGALLQQLLKTSYRRSGKKHMLNFLWDG